MSTLKSRIDYKSLEQELHKALEADELYKLQNDAKLRAVEQNVPTYEHFRQMVKHYANQFAFDFTLKCLCISDAKITDSSQVNGAHLKPLERTDIQSKHGMSWNPIPGCKNPSTLSCTLGKQDHAQEHSDKVLRVVTPKACEEFVQAWKNITDDEEKFTYLWANRRTLKESIFRIEIPPMIFGELITACSKNVSMAGDTGPVVELLTTLSTCNRFHLTACFMTDSEKEKCLELFQRLLEKTNGQSRSEEAAIKSLAAQYQLTL